MAEPYSIRILVPDGDPEGVKIVDLFHWTGVGVAFPRAAWPETRNRQELSRSGVYILIGSAEGASDDLPTVYIGQGDEIRKRIDEHFQEKEFWSWGYGFVSNAHPLNRAHITWLEYALIDHAEKANRSSLNNSVRPKEPTLSEFDKADTRGFLREMLRILPLLGVRVFEKATAVATPSAKAPPQGQLSKSIDRDTIVVPAKPEGFAEVFLGQNSWYAIRISGGMIPKIKYIAAYQSAPESAVTYYAPIERIEPYGEEGKYRLFFSEPAKTVPQGRIPLADAPQGFMQGTRYTSLERLLHAKKVTDLFS